MQIVWKKKTWQGERQISQKSGGWEITDENGVWWSVNGMPEGNGFRVIDWRYRIDEVI